MRRPWKPARLLAASRPGDLTRDGGREGAASFARTQDGLGQDSGTGRGREASRRACAGARFGAGTAGAAPVADAGRRR